MTSFAQAHGRNALSWDDKFKMDVWYTKNVTFRNDVKIIFDTVINVLNKKGISSETSATMEEFFWDSVLIYEHFVHGCRKTN